MEFSKNDLKVLAELVKDASRPERVLAKAAGVSRVTFRTKRTALEKQGVIRGYLPYVSNRAFNVSNAVMLAKFANSTTEEKARATKAIAQRNPKSIARTRGDWDMLLVFPFRHNIEAGQKWKQMTVNMPFSKTNLMLSGKLLQRERLPYDMDEEEFSFDTKPAFQRGLRRELTDDEVAILEDMADFPMDSIVKRLDRLEGSGESWRQRIVKLRKDGVLRGPCAWVDLRRLGYFRVHLLVSINPYTHDFEKSLTALIDDIPQVSYTEALSGAYSLRLSLIVKNPDELFGSLARLDGFWGKKKVDSVLLWEEYESVRRSVPKFK